jgi:sec-independent protein translocase protein TatC
MRKAFSQIFRIIFWPFRAIWWLLKTIFGWFFGLVREFSGLFADDPDETDLVDSFTKAVQDPGGILVHLNEFRRHITRAAVIFLLMTSASFFFAEQILEFLARPIGGTENLVATEVTDPVRVFMRVGLLAGFILSLPYIVLELLLFAAPGLKKNERRIGLTVIPLVTLLFVGGAAFSYFVILEPAITVLTTGFIFEAIPRPSDYYGFITQLLFWFGIAFEFPLVLYIMVRMGWVQAHQLLEQSRIALVIIAVVAAMITPTVDPINMLLVWGPLVGLYFLGVGMAYIAQGTRNRRLKREAENFPTS